MYCTCLTSEQGAGFWGGGEPVTRFAEWTSPECHHFLSPILSLRVFGEHLRWKRLATRTLLRHKHVLGWDVFPFWVGWLGRFQESQGTRTLAHLGIREGPAKPPNQ